MCELLDNCIGFIDNCCILLDVSIKMKADNAKIIDLPNNAIENNDAAH